MVSPFRKIQAQPKVDETQKASSSAIEERETLEVTGMIFFEAQMNISRTGYQDDIS